MKKKRLQFPTAACIAHATNNVLIGSSTTSSSTEVIFVNVLLVKNWVTVGSWTHVIERVEGVHLLDETEKT